MRQKRRLRSSDILAILALPGLCMGLISILWTPVDKTNWAAGMTLDDILEPLLKLGGILGLALIAAAIVVSIIEQTRKPKN